jgi:hypothetical protein
MYEKKFGFYLKGLSPLIMHWDNIDWADQMEVERTAIKENDKKQFKAGDDRCPPHTWKGYTYNDGEHIAVPNDCLRSCLLKASARVTLSGKKTYKELSQCGVLFDDLFVKFLNNGEQIPWQPVDKIAGVFAAQSQAVRDLGFALFVKRAAVDRKKHVRVRARFDAWSVEGSLTIIDEQIKDETLRRIWEIAGLYIGLCDWRPGSPKSPGPYGRFAATLKAA